jgi:hypothetical protein
VPREALVMVIDCPDPERVREFVGKAAQLRGKHRFAAAPTRMTVSQQLRGYYHGHIVQVFEDWLEDKRQPLPLDEHGDPLLSYHDYAHAILKLRCLKLPVFDADGELVGHVTGSTKGLPTDRMMAYVDRCRDYLWTKYELWTDDPDPEWRKKAAAVAARRRRRKEAHDEYQCPRLGA